MATYSPATGWRTVRQTSNIGAGATIVAYTVPAGKYAWIETGSVSSACTFRSKKFNNAGALIGQTIFTGTDMPVLHYWFMSQTEFVGADINRLIVAGESFEISYTGAGTITSDWVITEFTPQL